MVHYCMLSLVLFVPYGTENVPFSEYATILKFVARIHKIRSPTIQKNMQTFQRHFLLNLIEMTYIFDFLQFLKENRFKFI